MSRLGVRVRAPDGVAIHSGLVGGIDVHQRRRGGMPVGRKRPVKTPPVEGGLGQAQAALPPQDAGQLLHEVLLGRPLRRVLGRSWARDRGAR